MRRCVCRIDRQNIGKCRVGRQRCRHGRPAVGQHAALGKFCYRDGIALIASEDRNIVALVVIEKGDVTSFRGGAAAPEHDNAAALGILLEIVAECPIAARSDAAAAGIARKTQARADERGAPRRFVVLDLRMPGDLEHLDDLRIVDRSMDFAEAFEMRCYGKPGRWHLCLPIITRNQIKISSYPMALLYCTTLACQYESAVLFFLSDYRKLSQCEGVRIVNRDWK